MDTGNFRLEVRDQDGSLVELIERHDTEACLFIGNMAVKFAIHAGLMMGHTSTIKRVG